ncbi:unnamed protein product, partial [Sphacelaria rigidula]
DASELRDALLCPGPHQFEVAWSGEVMLTSTISISNESSVKVWGDVAGDAVIDGGGAVQLFKVDDGSTLELDGLSLTGGNASSLAEIHGGAVFLSNRSRLHAYSCSFFGNYAEDFGGRTFD